MLAAAFANDLCAGDLDSLTAAERRDRFAAEATARHRDKLNYRYPGPGGESYQDLIARCNELVCLLEQSRGTSLVICNAAVYRVLMGYFFGHTFKVRGVCFSLSWCREWHRAEPEVWELASVQCLRFSDRRIV